MRTALILSLALAGCSETPAEDTNPGTQIGGVDCDNDKVLLNVTDADGTATASNVTIDFPDGDQLVADCKASTCNLELNGLGTYDLSITGSPTGSYQGSFILDDSHVAGQHPADCGGGSFHLLELTVQLTDGGGGDIMTSNIGLRAFNSSGDAQSGIATITEPGGSPYPRTCRATRCWIDIPGMGTYSIDYAGDNGETGTTSVVVDSSHYQGLNELGDDIYEAEVRLVLAP